MPVDDFLVVGFLDLTVFFLATTFLTVFLTALRLTLGFLELDFFDLEGAGY